MPQLDRVEIPNRAVFRPPEVCEIAKVQPYVLRSWEAEFPDLGVAKTEGGPRLYRRADVERVLQLKHLVYVEGLTLSGARRRLGGGKGDGDVEPLPVGDVGELFGAEARERILRVKRGLQELSALLARSPAAAGAPAEQADAEPSGDGAAVATAPAESAEFELKAAAQRKAPRRRKSPA